MPPPLTLRPLVAADHAAVAGLLHRSLVQWYESHLGQGARFGDKAEPFRLFPEVYAALDPGDGIAATDTATGELLGVCFVHPRKTHVSLGIVATAPAAQGRGVARAMLTPALELARRTNRPARLVSSLLNLDSFSLYSRLGFVPHTLYQDLVLTVPATGLAVPAPSDAARVRPVTDPAEAARLAAFEYEWQGLHREQDYAFFLRNTVGAWRVWALENTTGDLEGFLVASHHPSCVMLGPGVAANDSAAAALLWRALDAMRGLTPVFLAPCTAAALVHQCYVWGARNVELHAAQATGPVPSARGIAFPTFLPESG
ncbi:MAG: GNAT family N-acetyltransferase [Verrucomicrobia bacterium]|nr:GNAT family N-acetyltransferase [Verrucomicrobiota bacterium]